MKRSDLMELEATVMKEVVRRRHLGGYSPDAEGILLIAEVVMRMLQHTIEHYGDPLPDIELQVRQVKAQRKVESAKKSSK